MLPLRVDSCKKAQDRIDGHNEEVCCDFEEAIEAQRDTTPWDGHISQVFDHVLFSDKKTSAL